ncbi:MAG: histidine phosphatase family protein [Proteobacteria bacterium]|nr:histidine phosphatase family protein [Pseudomonadota bacterium]
MSLYKTYTPGSKILPADLLGQSSAVKPLIFLLRHGRIQGYETKRFIGRTDVLLDDLGREQGLFWQTALSGMGFDAVYSSTLKRCMDTASLVCPEHKIYIESRLNEINMGTWDGKSFDEIRQAMPKEFEKRGQQMDSFKPPGGESFQDLQDRALPFFDEIRKKQVGRILLVTHAGVIRVILCRIMGLHPKDLFKIDLEYGQLFIISF